MTSFRFDHRLFQRGHSWRECLASWPGDRERLLSDVLDGETLSETASVLAGIDVITRIAVYFDPDSLDSIMTLPYAGNTFAGLDHIETRYFDQSFFFPVFYPVFGRAVPRIFFIGREGEPLHLWGPRPHELTREMEDAAPAGRARDEWLNTLNKSRHHTVLDRALAQSLGEKFPGSRPVQDGIGN